MGIAVVGVSTFALLLLASAAAGLYFWKQRETPPPDSHPALSAEETTNPDEPGADETPPTVKDNPAQPDAKETAEDKKPANPDPKEGALPPADTSVYVDIKAAPSGAFIYANDKLVGTGSTSLRFASKDAPPIALRVEKRGYQIEHLSVKGTDGATTVKLHKLRKPIRGSRGNSEKGGTGGQKPGLGFIEDDGKSKNKPKPKDRRTPK